MGASTLDRLGEYIHENTVYGSAERFNKTGWCSGRILESFVLFAVKDAGPLISEIIPSYYLGKGFKPYASGFDLSFKNDSGERVGLTLTHDLLDHSLFVTSKNIL